MNEVYPIYAKTPHCGVGFVLEIDWCCVVDMLSRLRLIRRVCAVGEIVQFLR